MSASEPTDDALDVLLDAEREIPVIDATRHARILRGVETRAGKGTGGGGVGGQPRHAIPPWQLALGGAGLFVLGGLTGAWLFAQLAPSARPAPSAQLAPSAQVSSVVTVTSPVRAEGSSEVRDGAPQNAMEQLAEPASLPSVRDGGARERLVRTRDAPTSASPIVDTLADERRILDTARAALARGRAEESLIAVSRHAEHYPSGQLSEERESLRIQALVRAGYADRAEPIAARFRSDYPRSIFLPAIEAALSGPASR